MVLTDQQSAEALSAAGNRDLTTPHLDALAARGTRFERAYCTQPLCTPARASLWTGRTPTEVDVRGNGKRLATDHAEHQLGRLLSSAGYDCGYAGKWHLPELDVPDHSGFRRVHPETEDGLVDSCARFLNEERQSPFALVVSLTEPHGICEWARGQTPPSGPVPEVDWTRWPALRANFAAPADPPALPETARGLTPHPNPTGGWSTDDWRRYLYAYYRLCERADRQVGALLAALEQSGRDRDTMIIFSSDHGDQMGAHGWNQKWVLYEESTRIPLIVVEPGHERPGEVREDLVSVGLDLLPTLCRAAEVQPPTDLTGHSLLTRDRGQPWRETVHVETGWEVAGVNDLTGRSVRDGRYKYVCYAWGQHREQLVDLVDDPGELTDLSRVGAHQERLQSMRDLVRRECERVGDARFARFIPPVGGAPV